MSLFCIIYILFLFIVYMSCPQIISVFLPHVSQVEPTTIKIGDRDCHDGEYGIELILKYNKRNKRIDKSCSSNSGHTSLSESITSINV